MDKNNTNKNYQTNINSIKSKKPIAFFDSGVGGLTVYKEVKTLLPNEDFLYFGDTLNMPYGEKTKTELIEIARKIFDFFAQKEVKAVVMACNTTSAMTYEVLKDNYDFEIFPIIQSVAKVMSTLPIKNLGIFATPATINSHAYANAINKINPNINVTEIACPSWVRIVENNKLHDKESYFLVQEKMNEMLLNNPENIILGCTHYPYLKELLKHFYPLDKLIDPSNAFAQFIKNTLITNNLINNQTNGSEKFYVSSSPENFKQASKLFCELKELPELIKL